MQVGTIQERCSHLTLGSPDFKGLHLRSSHFVTPARLWQLQLATWPLRSIYLGWQAQDASTPMAVKGPSSLWGGWNQYTQFPYGGVQAASDGVWRTTTYLAILSFSSFHKCITDWLGGTFGGADGGWWVVGLRSRHAHKSHWNEGLQGPHFISGEDHWPSTHLDDRQHQVNIIC